MPPSSSTSTLDATSTSATAVPMRTNPDPHGPIEIPEWDFRGPSSQVIAPGWYGTALTYTRSNVSLARPSPATVPFTEFYNFTFASYESSRADDCVFIELWGGGDHDMFIEGFALFGGEIFSENFPRTIKPINLSAPWSAEVRKVAAEETKKWAPNAAMLRLRRIWSLPEIEKGIGDNAEEKIEVAVEDGREGTKVGTKGVEDMAEEVANVLKSPKDDIGDEGY
ncbi:hypothetical protein B9Z19DRAFT_1067581 [Tuber borchii]|uniref:Uncharacterized protein n=1 Tax=Tuber borchii TaxID=42251 RepID=A0A2T6ZID0_TUBBO|nr:hypothetical protein B9Z19DRAFT_1067581 [Tuber borchii]